MLTLFSFTKSTETSFGTGNSRQLMKRYNIRSYFTIYLPGCCIVKEIASENDPLPCTLLIP